MRDLIFFFELTNRCQLSCLHCMKDNGERSQSLPLELIKDVLDQASNYGVRKLGFSGGEPTLHPQFDEILALACRKNLPYSLVTNGWNFPETSPLLKDCGGNLEQVVFSLDGAQEETHDYLRKPGSRQRISEAISICQQEKIPFGLQMVVNARNYGEVPDMCLLAARVGARTLRFMELQPTPGAARRGLDLPPRKYLEIGAQVAWLAKAFRFPMVMAVGSHAMTRWWPCFDQHMEEFNIDCQGNLALCSALMQRVGGVPGTEVAGNIAEIGLYEAHRRLIRLIARFQEDKATAIEKGTVNDNDLYFPCWYCAKYFHKVDWLADFPDNPWNSKLDTSELPVPKSLSELQESLATRK